ncbi:MAG: MBOAT family O-acyltransferase [Peptoniphilus sp.]|nr:MBOAT family O-acyltransferase [Peptoniphilus sp.]MDY3118282.1 MBOAT family O-acyltransferase [Peptoniphilus sp.]
MAFTELSFLFFVALFVLVYRACGCRWQVLLVASFLYYALYDVRAFFYLFTAILTTYFAGKVLYERKSRPLLFFTLAVNFALLSLVKFTDLSAFTIAIPLGISFYTFQATSYAIDLYRKKYPPADSLWKYALYLSFFPQIVQGPISRYDAIEADLYRREARSDWFSKGLLLLLYGYFKKLIIANRASVVVAGIFDHPDEFGGGFIFVAIMFYSIQIYSDFSGGIDIARGVAYLFGVELSENFKRPFFATSLTDFWRRWHITLGAWMRDYVFFPLSLTKLFGAINKKSRRLLGRHGGKVLTLTISTYIVYLLIGIWHGGGFNFIAFGLYNGTLISLSLLFEKRFKAIKKALHIDDRSVSYRIFQVLRTTFLVFVGRYFTRSGSLSQAMFLLSKTLCDFTFRHGNFGVEPKDFLIIVLAFFVVAVISFMQEKGVDITERILCCKTPVKAGFLLATMAAILYFGIYAQGYTAVEFIYRNY